MSNPDFQYIDKDLLSKIPWDSYVFTSNTTSDVWQYYIAGALYMTITVNYSDATKTLETGGSKVFA